MKNILTKRQVEILNKIKDYQILNGNFPSLRTLGSMTDIKSPNGVKRHLDALYKKGYINYSQNRYSLILNKEKDYVEVKVLGFANAGQPLTFAEEDDMGVIKIDNKKLKNKQIFAVIINGDSMNLQQINGKKLNDNDYAIVEATKEFNNGDTVLVIIDNAATIKNIATKKDYTVLYPKSDNIKHREIYVGNNEDFFINGKVIDVLPSVL